MRKIALLLLFLGLAGFASAQVSNPSIISVTTAPTGSCSAGLPNQQVVSTGVMYSCHNIVSGKGTWGQSSSGSGIAVAAPGFSNISVSGGLSDSISNYANLLNPSQGDMNLGGPWNTDGATITCDVSAPDGSSTGCSIVAPAAGTKYPRYQFSTFSASGSYIFSIYAEAFGVALQTVNLAYFNGTAWTACPSFSPTTVWKRYYCSFTLSGATALYVAVQQAATASGQGVAVWGWQVESPTASQTYPGPYIPTYTGQSKAAVGPMQPQQVVTVPANGLAQTPPMGWSSWNSENVNSTDSTIRAQTDALVSSGLSALGYKYIVIAEPDVVERDGQGYPIVDATRWPNGVSSLVSYIHSKGLLAGWYTTPSWMTCAGYLGSFGFERQDASAYASWGIDYLEYDYCFGIPNASAMNVQTAMQYMGQLLQGTGRNILFFVNVTGAGISGLNWWTWAKSAGINTARSTTDVACDWAGMSTLFDNQPADSSAAGPGYYNDADMLCVGNGLTDDEGRSQFAIDSILASPLILGNDVTSMSATTLQTLSNTDIIAVDQDPAGKQGQRISQTTCGASTCEVWARQLTGTDTCAIALLNRDSVAHDITATFATIAGTIPGCGSGPYTNTRDLENHVSLGTLTTSYTATAVPSHGVAMIKVAP